MGSTLGGERGRLVDQSDKIRAVELIKEAVLNKASLKKSCAIIEISVRTYQRWKRGDGIDKRKGAKKRIARKLTEEERQEIIEISCNEEFKDSNPYDIFITLLERNRYIASISSFYRILKEQKLINHRSNKKSKGKINKPPEVKSSGPNQVWTWDITYLSSNIKGFFFYAYMIIDIWDRKIVGWEIHDKESDKYSRSLFDKTLSNEGDPDVHIHSDNGHPMKGLSLLSLLHDLGCNNSYSRPRVSNDNPFIESFFGSMKTTVKYPDYFKNIAEARIWMADFVDWYNNQHRHSGINYFTPQQMRNGKFIELTKIRNKTMKKAFNKNPERWSSKVKQWDINHIVFLNPSMKTKIKMKNSA